MTAPRNWPELLSQLSRFLLETDALENSIATDRFFTPEQHARGTLTYPPAAPEAIEAAQARLQIQFPPSYRAFLETSNGLDQFGDAIFPGALWPVENVKSLREQKDYLIDIALSNAREFNLGDSMKPMETALSLSDHSDGSDLFLCPALLDENGEMECWIWASWKEEGFYGSFEAWMLHEWASAAHKWQTVTRFGVDGFARFDEILVAAYPVEDAHDLGARLELFRAEAKQNTDLALWLPNWLELIDFKRKSDALEARLQTLRSDFEDVKIVDNREIVGGSLETLPARLEKRRADGLELLESLRVQAARWTI